MGIRLYVEVLDYAPTTLTHREKLLLAVLAEDAPDETRVTWNSVESPLILRRAKLTRPQVYEVLRALIAKGALKRVVAGQKNGTAKYKLLPLGPAQCPQIPDTDTPPQCPEFPDTDASQRPGTPDTDRSQCPQIPDPQPALQSPRIPDTELPQCPENPDPQPRSSVRESRTPTPHYVERDISTPPHATPAPRHATPDTSAAFDAFWREYPRKVAKGAARRAFDKALKRGSAAEHIAAAAARHREHWKRSGRQLEYVPYPATWLNNESYDDDLTDPGPPQAPAARPVRWSDPTERGIF